MGEYRAISVRGTLLVEAKADVVREVFRKLGFWEINNSKYYSPHENTLVELIAKEIDRAGVFIYGEKLVNVVNVTLILKDRLEKNGAQVKADVVVW